MDTNHALFWDVLEKRSSVRRYKEDPVPQEMLNNLIKAMKMAPVASGNRNVDCRIITDRQEIEKIAAETHAKCVEAADSIPDDTYKSHLLAYSKNFYWFSKAPALLAISARKMPSFMSVLGDDADDLFGSKASAAMAAENILLAATAQGLGSCCLTGPLLAKKWLQKRLNCPPQNALAMLITIGFPANGMKHSGDIPPVEEGK
jgi:nitroreductase